MPTDGGAAVVEAARQRTLAAHGARLRLQWFFDPPHEEYGGFIFEGVADLAQRRVRGNYHLDWVEELGRWLFEGFPWLDDEGGEEGEDEDTSAVVFVGDDSSYFGDGDRWVVTGASADKPPRQPPLWILDALASFESRSADDAGRFHGRVHGDEELDADVWVGDDGLIHRVTWSPRRGTRRRPGLIMHVLALLQRSPTDHIERRPWTTLELWDFGMDVDIPVPVPAPLERDTALFKPLLKLGYEMWKRRRRWRKAHPGAG